LPLHDVAGSTLPDMIVEYGQTDLRQLDQLCQIDVLSVFKGKFVQVINN